MNYLSHPDLNDLSKDASLELLRELHSVGQRIYEKAYAEKWMKELLGVIETLQTPKTAENFTGSDEEVTAGPSTQGLVKHLYQMQEKGYIEGLLSYFADEAVVTFPGGHAFRGKQAVKTFFGEFLSNQFPDLTRTPLNFIVSDTHVACEGTIDGMAANGKPFKAVPFIDVFENRADGKILRGAMYLDLPEIRSQIGKW